MDRVYSRRRSRSPVRRNERPLSGDGDRQGRQRDRHRAGSRSPSLMSKRSSIRSRSPVDRKGHGGNRDNPSPSRVLGIFGLSIGTSEGQIRQIFSKFGPIDKLQLVYDTKTGHSRGFCFVYYQNTEDARAAKDQCTGMEIDRQRIRVDYSLTARPHSPTPGVYMGRSTRGHESEMEHRGKERGDRERERDRDYHNSSAPPYRRRRSPSPQYRRRRNRSTSYSPRMR